MDLIKTLDRVYLDIYRVHPRLIEEYYNIAVDETGMFAQLFVVLYLCYELHSLRSRYLHRVSIEEFL